MTTTGSIFDTPSHAMKGYAMTKVNKCIGTKSNVQSALSIVSYRVKDFLEMGGYPKKSSYEASCIIENISASLKELARDSKQEQALALQGLEGSLNTFLWFVMGTEKSKYVIERICEEFQELCQGIELINNQEQ